MSRTGTFEELARASRARAEADMAARGLAELEGLIATLPPVRSLAMRLAPGSGPAPRVVGEMVRRGVGGILREPYQPRLIATGFARAGAAAVCVSTDPSSQGGALDHLHEVRSANLPVLQHDFLVTPYQVAQARVAGADALVLHTALLEGAALALMAHAARRYGLEAIAVAHDEAGLIHAAEAGAALVCVRGRDPATWPEAPESVERLGPRLRALAPDALALAWGGIRGRDDIDRLTASGYQAFVAGEALMGCPDPGDALWRLLQPR
jgi:indole-3-glycerol phosphate synthase